MWDKKKVIVWHIVLGAKRIISGRISYAFFRPRANDAHSRVYARSILKRALRAQDVSVIKAKAQGIIFGIIFGIIMSYAMPMGWKSWGGALYFALSSYKLF